MALAKKCDRCKEFYEHYPKGNKKECNAIRRVYKDEKCKIMSQDDSLDLCPDCRDAFTRFMTTVEKRVKHDQT